MKNNITVYIVTFGKYINLVKDNIYTPLLAGAENNNIISDCVLDNTGDNISYKNSSYEILTALYWVWKNSDSNITGLIQYRRYFINGIFGKKLNEEDIYNYLEKHDIIVAKAANFYEGSLRKHFENTKEWNITYENIPILENIIKELYPDYLDAFNQYLDGNRFYPFSMFIAYKKFSDQYSEWLFNILDEFEKIIGWDFDENHKYGNHFFKKRAHAVVGEFLFGVWLVGTNINIKECYVYRVEALSNFFCILDENYLQKRLTKYFYPNPKL